MDEEMKVLQLGKHGVTDSFIKEAMSQLKKSKALKVRMLKTAFAGKEKDGIAEEVAFRTKAELVDVRGNTFTLRKR